MNIILALINVKMIFILAISDGNFLKMYSSTLPYFPEETGRTVITYLARGEGPPSCTACISKMLSACFKILNHYRIFKIILQPFYAFIIFPTPPLLLGCLFSPLQWAVFNLLCPSLKANRPQLMSSVSKGRVQGLRPSPRREEYDP